MAVAVDTKGRVGSGHGNVHLGSLRSLVAVQLQSHTKAWLAVLPGVCGGTGQTSAGLLGASPGYSVAMLLPSVALAAVRTPRHCFALYRMTRASGLLVLGATRCDFTVVTRWW